MSSTEPKWVVKIGSSVIAGEQGGGLISRSVQVISDQVGALRKQGIQVLLVSSGAVALGMARTGQTDRPRTLDSLQALAALGQADLLTRWRTELSRYQLDAALVLLTRWDTEDRRRYLNIRNTLERLRQLGIVPVINENDSVATEAMKFDDNDILAGLVVNLVSADRLVLMTDRDGLYDKDPALHPDARLIDQAEVLDSALDDIATPSVSRLGRGGMRSKLQAARLAANSGADSWIVNGFEEEVLLKLAAGETTGTHLRCGRNGVSARQSWLASRAGVRGTLVLDDGASRAVLHRGASLLPVGVKDLQGDFQSGDLVSCLDTAGREIATGLINHDSALARQMIGKHSSELQELFAHPVAEELIHRNNMLILPVPGTDKP